MSQVRSLPLALSVTLSGCRNVAAHCSPEKCRGQNWIRGFTLKEPQISLDRKAKGVDELIILWIFKNASLPKPNTHIKWPRWNIESTKIQILYETCCSEPLWSVDITIGLLALYCAHYCTLCCLHYSLLAKAWLSHTSYMYCRCLCCPAYRPTSCQFGFTLEPLFLSWLCCELWMCTLLDFTPGLTTAVLSAFQILFYKPFS